VAQALNVMISHRSYRGNGIKSVRWLNHQI
jgi:hypothetical protein